MTPPVGASLTLATGASRGAGHALGRALAVGVADDHPDLGADIGIAERVGRLVGADIDEAGAGRAATGNAACRARRHRPASRYPRSASGPRSRAADRDAAGRRVVDVGDRRSRGTGHALRRALAVGVADHHPDLGADIGVAQRVGRRSAPTLTKPEPVALPLVVQRAEPVGIGQRRGSAVRTWSSVAVPLIVTPPVGASLTLAIGRGRALVTLSAVPWPSV